MSRTYTGADVPELVGYTVEIDHGVHVIGVIESWAKDNEFEPDATRIRFSSVEGHNKWRNGYMVRDTIPIRVLETDVITDLERYLAQAIAERRQHVNPVYSDFQAANAVVKALEALVNGD
jgi:hypothetical protein